MPTTSAAATTLAKSYRAMTMTTTETANTTTKTIAVCVITKTAPGRSAIRNTMATPYNNTTATTASRTTSKAAVTSVRLWRAQSSVTSI